MTCIGSRFYIGHIRAVFLRIPSGHRVVRFCDGNGSNIDSSELAFSLPSGNPLYPICTKRLGNWSFYLINEFPSKWASWWEIHGMKPHDRTWFHLAYQKICLGSKLRWNSRKHRFVVYCCIFALNSIHIVPWSYSQMNITRIIYGEFYSVDVIKIIVVDEL